MTLGAAAISFPATNVGASSVRSVVLSNAGAAPLNPSIESNNPAFTVAHACGTLAPGGDCVVNVTFTPAAGQSYSGALSVSAAGSSAQATLSGTGVVQTAGFEVSTNNLTTFQALVGGQSASQGFTVYSTGGLPVELQSVTVEGPFTVTSPNCALPRANLSSCTFAVVFQPTAVSSNQTGSIAVTTSVGSTTIALNGGEANGPTIAGTMTFGAVASNSNGSLTLSYTNPGPVAATGVNASLSAGTPNTVTVTANTCNNATVAPNGSCAVTVRWAPNGQGDLSNAGVTFTASNTATKSATLTGTQLLVSGAMLTSGGLNWYTPPAATQQTWNSAQTYCAGTVNGMGGWRQPTTAEAQALFGSVSKSVFDAAGWHTEPLDWYWTSNDYAGGHKQVAQYSGNLWSHAGTSNLYWPVCVRSAGQAEGEISGSADFGTVVINAAPVDRVLTYTNTGDAPATGVMAALQAGTPSSVTLQATTCNNVSLAPAASCTATVRFAPTTAGTLTGAAVEFTSASAVTKTSTLTGVGDAGHVYATWNGVRNGAALSNGNLTTSWIAGGAAGGSSPKAYSSTCKSSGKWYWELRLTALGSNGPILGIATAAASTTDTLYDATTGNVQMGYYADLTRPGQAKAYTNANYPLDGRTLATAQVNDVFGFAMDMDNRTLRVSRNGATLYTFTNLNAATAYCPHVGYNTATVTANFGASPFTYSVPAGFNSGLY